MTLFHFPFTRKLGLLVLGSLLLLEGNIRSHGILNTTRPNLEVSLEFELANNGAYDVNAFNWSILTSSSYRSVLFKQLNTITSTQPHHPLH